MQYISISILNSFPIWPHIMDMGQSGSHDMFYEQLMVLSCDTSPYGVGAVHSNINDSGQDMPVAFASSKLNACERPYSQLDKEGLSVVFGVCKFHKYLEGCKFRIQTDHKPLLGLTARFR